MKRPLSLTLLLALCFSGVFPPCAAPARAQEVASVGNLGRLREEYEQLLSVERNPATTPEVREMNRAFLEERRTQLAAALRERIGALRKYEEMVAGSLGEGERRAVAGSIQRLVQELQALQPAQAAPPPFAPSTRPARRPSRVTKAAPAAAETSTAGPAPAEPQEQPAPTPTPETPKEAPKQDAPIAITSPANNKTVGVSEVELEVVVADKKVNELNVAIYKPDSQKISNSRNYELLRSDEDKKTIVVGLYKGENRIVVSDRKRGDVKAEIKLTYQPPTDPPVGRAGASAAGPARSTTLSATTERWRNVPEAGSDVRVGYTGDPDKSYQFYVKKRSGGASQNIDATMKPGSSGVVSAVFPDLAAGDLVGVVEVDNNGAALAGTRDEIVVESALEEGRGGPFGLLLGGVVMSQQAQEFQQADPFFGFTAGYISKLRNANRLSRKDACGTQTTRYIETNVRNLYATPDGLAVRCVNGTWQVSDRKITQENANAAFVRNTGFSGWRWNLRFQGLFQSDPRKATATDTTTTDDNNGGGGGQAAEPFNFIASRKTFNVETQLWVDFWANSAFSIGPYAAVGASTVLDKNELQGEAVTDGSQAEAGEGADTVATQSKSDNDLKKYYEGGALMNVLLNRDLFLQSILAYRHDEALSGLYNGPADCKLCDTQHRFVGKLRIFPFGLARGFGRQVRMAPMFGVEVNAGRGPDHIKFFSGFAMRIKGISISDSGAKLAGAAADDADTKNDAATGGGSNP